MKKIIVPVDFSDQSNKALKVAASLASKHNAELVVLHMLELNAVMISSEGLPQEQVVFLLKLTEKRFSEFLDKPFLKDLTVTPIIKHYKVFSEVNEVAEEHKADLIVMGSHGVDGLEEIFIGSNTERVVRNATVPVLVIKDDIEDFTVNSIVFASSFNEDNIPAFHKVKSFANLLGAKINYVYINTPGDNFLSTEDAYTRIAQFISKTNAGIEVEIYNDYTVEKGILNYSNTTNADLIAISTHGRKGLSHFFMGSIGEDVANHATIPVVTFKI
ncbi:MULTISPECIES: universal stress protein [Cellulophaga]|uniref:UspA domain-containing protein n=2 Tax=Cellulophaga TaxID=104264 RepID=F0RFQ8_CELLC|nr:MULTISPECIES: universal stress protein [Cellulophaga]ADY30033.1 UspA domain-containing protein [Cellulophaga lytica DSM 7489]AIM61026.1 universal stress protein UspA [Cellulophaga lytica]APU10892.1 universal stress protein UspA [Cellulophaga lytica]EWH14920.1 UspA domain-containing protein [Cellulophaga geojensis KL-A]TVZ10640.1 nucleotide-binding universal stress UspA family protein [Cellulophaga sp. RHA_52]